MGRNGNKWWSIWSWCGGMVTIFDIMQSLLKQNPVQNMHWELPPKNYIIEFLCFLWSDCTREMHRVWSTGIGEVFKTVVGNSIDQCVEQDLQLVGWELYSCASDRRVAWNMLFMHSTVDFLRIVLSDWCQERI